MAAKFSDFTALWFASVFHIMSNFKASVSLDASSSKSFCIDHEHDANPCVIELLPALTPPQLLSPSPLPPPTPPPVAAPPPLPPPSPRPVSLPPPAPPQSPAPSTAPSSPPSPSQSPAPAPAPTPPPTFLARPPPEVLKERAPPWLKTNESSPCVKRNLCRALHQVFSILKVEQLGRNILILAVPMIIGLFTVNNLLQGPPLFFKLTAGALALGVSLIWNGMLLRNIVPEIAACVELLGVLLLLAAFYVFISCFLSGYLTFVPGLCFLSTILPFALAFWQKDRVDPSQTAV